MKLDIIKIGNSQGIRLPKALLKQCNLKGRVIVKVEDGKLILLPDTEKHAREGWDTAFKKMAEAGDDALCELASFELSLNEEDWEW